MIFRERKNAPRIRVENAKKLLKDGLYHYLEGIPEWLPEYDSIAEWLTDNKGKGLLLKGDSGLGKSRICLDIIPDILRSIGIACFCVSSYNMSEHRNELFSAEVLVVDDIGIEDKFSNYGERRDLFPEVVDQVEREGILLIVTTNLEGKLLNERYGLRTLDRLNGLVKPVVLNGKSLRKVPLRQPFYAFGFRFDTEEECDKFIAGQEAIWDGLENGRYKLNDRAAERAREAQEPLKVRDGIVYCYDD